MPSEADAAILALKAKGLESLPPLAIVLGSGLGPLADEAADAIAIPYADIPGFPSTDCGGPCGAARRGRDRGQAGRAVSGPRPLLRAGRCGRDAGRHRDLPPPRRRDADPHQRRRRPQHGLEAAVARRHHRPYQFRRRQSADRRRGRRQALRPADRRLRQGPARHACISRRRPKASICTTASICGSRARASRRRPRSAPPAFSAPISSACRPCRKSSSPASSDCAAPPCRSSPTMRRACRAAIRATTRRRNTRASPPPVSGGSCARFIRDVA